MRKPIKLKFQFQAPRECFRVTFSTADEEFIWTSMMKKPPRKKQKINLNLENGVTRMFVVQNVQTSNHERKAYVELR